MSVAVWAPEGEPEVVVLEDSRGNEIARMSADDADHLARMIRDAAAYSRC